MTEAATKRFKILFLCTGNSARSILAEYFLRRLDPVHFDVFSAGANPKGAGQSLRARNAERGLPHRRERRPKQVLGRVSRREVRLRHHRLRQSARKLPRVAGTADHRSLGFRRSRRRRGRRRREKTGGQESRRRNPSAARTLHGSAHRIPRSAPPGGGDAIDRETVEPVQAAGSSFVVISYLNLSGSNGSTRPSAVSACGYMK